MKRGAVRVYVRKLDYSQYMPQTYQFEEKSTPANSSDDENDDDHLLGENSKIKTNSFYNLSWEFPYVVVELDKLQSANPTVHDVAVAAVAKAQTEWSGWKYKFMKQFEAEEKRLREEQQKLEEEEEELARRERAMSPGKMTPIKIRADKKTRPSRSAKLRQHLLSLNMSTVDCYDTNEEATLPVTILEKLPVVIAPPPAAGTLGATTTVSRRLSQPYSITDMSTPRAAATLGSGTRQLVNNNNTSMTTATYHGGDLSRSLQGSPLLSAASNSSFAAQPEPIPLFLEELDQTRLERCELVTLPEKLDPVEPLEATREASLVLSFPRTLLVVDKPSRLVDSATIERSLRELREYTIEKGSLKEKRAKKALKERQQQISKEREENVKKVSQERDMRQVRSVLQSHKTQEEWQLRRTASRSNMTAGGGASLDATRSTTSSIK